MSKRKSYTPKAIKGEARNNLRRIRKIIGGNIHRCRDRAHMTLEKLARSAGIRTDRLDRIELGRGEVRIEDIVRIAEVLEVAVEEVMG